MNLTYGEFNSAKPALIVLMKSDLITEYKDILAIAEFSNAVEDAEKRFTKANNAIVFKYGKLADARIDPDGAGIDPEDSKSKGYNTVEELELQQYEIDALLDTLYPEDFNFTPISNKTIVLLLKGIPEIKELEKDGKKTSKETGRKLQCLTPQQMGSLLKLGLIKKEGK